MSAESIVGAAQAAKPSSVTICIPTWRSREFISRTLDFALGQTHEDIHVLVSVDHCDDGTAEACLERAGTEPRLEVIVQSDRLGWAGNVNALLDQVRTDAFCLYFHDDEIVPHYVERLLDALRARPDAASVHCDMGHFGASDHVSEAVDYPTNLAQRLAWFFVAPNRGSPLRSLTRSDVLGRSSSTTPPREAPSHLAQQTGRAGERLSSSPLNLRMPTDAIDGLWANEPYLLRLLANGPALRVPETLYYRWDKRAGGLTDGWKKLTLDQQLEGFRKNTTTFLATIDACDLTEAERHALRWCVQLNVTGRIRMLESEYSSSTTHRPTDIHASFADDTAPDLSLLGPELETWASQRQAHVAELTAGSAGL